MQEVTMLDSLRLENVIISRSSELNEKILSIKNAGGLNSLHVIADYDATITKRFVYGKKIQGSFALLRKPGFLTPDYPKKDEAMFDLYHPLELDTKMSLDEKKKHMQDWWEQHLQLVIDCGLRVDTLHDIVASNDASFRDFIHDFFSFMHTNTIPLLIFSAGLGDIINGFLKKEGFFSSNVHVISNFFATNTAGDIVGFKDQIVHTHNKSETQLEKTDFGNEIKERKNVVLLGDQLADLAMSEGLVHDTIIRIGFLNEKEDELLPLFKEKFDIIITNDGSFEAVMALFTLLE